MLLLLPLGSVTLIPGGEAAQPAPLAGEHMTGPGFLHQLMGSGERKLFLQVSFRNCIHLGFIEFVSSFANTQTFLSTSSPNSSWQLVFSIPWGSDQSLSQQYLCLEGLFLHYMFWWLCLSLLSRIHISIWGDLQQSHDEWQGCKDFSVVEGCTRGFGISGVLSTGSSTEALCQGNTGERKSERNRAVVVS